MKDYIVQLKIRADKDSSEKEIKDGLKGMIEANDISYSFNSELVDIQVEEIKL